MCDHLFCQTICGPARFNLSGLL